MRALLVTSFAVLTGAALLFSAGCESKEARGARRAIREVHAGEISKILNEDITRHRRGVRLAAERLAPGFVVTDPAERERGMRVALKALSSPERSRVAIGELVVSPMTYLAAIGPDGVVIARDLEPDAMRGINFGERYPFVRTALERSEPAFALGETTADDGSQTYTMMFVHPARAEGRVVGAVAAGIPLWRMAQRLDRQLKLDHAGEEDLILWVYFYKGDRLFHHGTPEVVDAQVPDAAARAAGLGNSPGGYTMQTQILGRWYAFGVLPTPSVGEDVGVIIVRSDPMNAE